MTRWGSQVRALYGPFLFLSAIVNPKQQAAEAAIQFVQSNKVVGLGTGSTADFFLVALARALKDGTLKNIRGVATSVAAEKRAKELGIPLATLIECPNPDVTIDGADEVAPDLSVIKGLGGALLREKIVAQASKKLVIIADSSKAVQKLGTRSPLPVEVTPFAHETHIRFFESIGATPTLRRKSDGSIYITDNANYIYDCRFKEIDDPEATEQKLKNHAGIVETGLFVGIASVALLADGAHVQKMAK